MPIARSPHVLWKTVLTAKTKRNVIRCRKPFQLGGSSAAIDAFVRRGMYRCGTSPRLLFRGTTIHSQPL